MRAEPISVAVVKELLHLDESTGQLWWKPRDWSFYSDRGELEARRAASIFNSRYAGKIAGNESSRGYQSVCIMQRDYRVHRVVFALANGDWPKGEVDHINHDRRDNRPANLRDVSGADNHLNLKRYSANKSGVAGVAWIARYQRWRAEICKSGQRVHLGVFLCFGQAVAARRRAERRLGFHENHGR